jgi:hypothetical protein
VGEAAQEGGEIVREGGLEAVEGAGGRVAEAEDGGVQAEAGAAAGDARRGVEGVAHEGEAALGEVDADLVGAAGLEGGLDEGDAAREGGEAADVREGGPGVGRGRRVRRGGAAASPRSRTSRE